MIHPGSERDQTQRHWRCQSQKQRPNCRDSSRTIRPRPSSKLAILTRFTPTDTIYSFPGTHLEKRGSQAVFRLSRLSSLLPMSCRRHPNWRSRTIPCHQAKGTQQRSRRDQTSSRSRKARNRQSCPLLRRCLCASSRQRSLRLLSTRLHSTKCQQHQLHPCPRESSTGLSPASQTSSSRPTRYRSVNLCLQSPWTTCPNLRHRQRRCHRRLRLRNAVQQAVTG